MQFKMVKLWRCIKEKKMQLNKWNQMFIKSVEHWEVDALERFEKSDFIREHADGVMRWHSDGAEYKIDTENCPFCIKFKGQCELCPINNSEECCHEFDLYYDHPCVGTAQHMIDWLIYVAQNKSRYEI